MEEYPRSLAEFETWFSSEQECRDFLYRLTWPTGFTCPRCGGLKAWPIATMLYERSSCHYQLLVISGMIFQATHKPLTVWLRAIWWGTGQKNGASALGLKHILGLGSYRTACP
ncbi:MAG: transposase [Deltaproteobacteria bacterium]|nr:transposase [Deltaproteobacteria bacterium]